MSEPLSVVLIAREKGSGPIIPVRDQYGDTVDWRNGPVEKGQTFRWRWPSSLPVAQMSELDQLAHLPLWCDIEGDPKLQNRLRELRSNPDQVVASRHRTARAKQVRSPGGFDPFRRHRAPEGEEKLEAAPEGEKGPDEDDTAEIPEGMSGGKAGYYDLRVGDVVERVRGKEAAKARYEEMQREAEPEPEPDAEADAPSERAADQDI